MDKRLHISAKNTTDLLPNERVLHAASAGGVDSPSQGARITVGIVNRIAPQNAMCKRWDTLSHDPGIQQEPIVIDLEQRQLIPQARFALTQRIDPAPDRRYALPDVQVEPLHKGGI